MKSAFSLKARLRSFNKVSDTYERREKKVMCVCSVLKMEEWWVPTSNFPEVMTPVVHSTAVHSPQERYPEFTLVNQSYRQDS